jgi:hypothetical protein
LKFDGKKAMGQPRTGWFREVLEDLKKRDKAREFCSSTHVKH